MLVVNIAETTENTSSEYNSNNMLNARKKYEPIVPKPLFYGALAFTIGFTIWILYQGHVLSNNFMNAGAGYYPLKIHDGWFMGYRQVG